MSLLDRFRGQPEWQHDDPSVRASAVDDLEDDAQELLTAIAFEDADPGVRVAAVVRLTDPSTLGRIHEAEQDEAVRAEAAAVLREMAVAGDDEARAAAAVTALSEPRDLGEVARTAALESVSLSALARLDVPKTIGAVARRSTHAPTRRAALERLDDRDELLAVALKSDHRDAALGAFERLVPEGPDAEADPELLQALAVRARAKPVARRARTMLAAQVERPAGPSAEDRQQRRAQLSARVESLARVKDFERLSNELEQLERNWAALDEAAGAEGDAAEAVEAADPSIERWHAAVEQARSQLAALEQAHIETQRVRQVEAEADAARLAVCDRLETQLGESGSDAETLLAAVAEARAGWEASAASAGPTDDDRSALEHRFDALVARAEGQVQRQRSAADRLVRLNELVATLEEVSQSDEVEGLRKRWTAPHAEWAELVGGSASEDVAELVARADGARTKVEERLQALREQRRRREQATLVKQQKRCGEIEQALANENLELREAERWLRMTRSVLGNMGRLPSKEDRDALTRRFHGAQTALTGRVRELRGLAEWKQWANLGVQAALCQRIEALAKVDDDAAMAKEYRQVMAEWRDAADVPRGEGDEIWKRFKTAHEAIQPRVDAFQSVQDALREEHSVQKLALCEEAERLTESTDWVKTAQRFTEMQAEWKAIGPATRKRERELWNRFRAASGGFFKRRRDDLADRRKVWGKNAEAKEALCGQAEALSEETDLATAKEAVKRLQAEWKTIGSVKRSRSEALWKRFRAACDAVFDRAQAITDAEFAEKITARAAVCERLEAFVPAPDAPSADPPDSLKDAVAAARTEWRGLPAVPRVQERSLTARFETALGALVERYPAAFAGTDLDPERNRAALERLCTTVEGLLEETPPPSASDRSPAEILAAQLREALASNTMGARVDPAAKRRADADTVKRAQSERRAIGLVPGDTGRRLSERFRTACDRFFKKFPPPASGADSRSRGHGAPRRRSRPRSTSGPRGRG